MVSTSDSLSLIGNYRRINLIFNYRNMETFETGLQILFSFELKGLSVRIFKIDSERLSILEKSGFSFLEPGCSEIGANILMLSESLGQYNIHGGKIAKLNEEIFLYGAKPQYILYIGECQFLMEQNKLLESIKNISWTKVLFIVRLFEPLS